jgi:peptidyl-prolyl cis-trans isomerase SurA
MNQTVWGKAVEDTLGLQQYFLDNQQSYYWGKRADAAIISTSDKSVLKDIKETLGSTSIKLFEIELDPKQKTDILKDPSLDSLVNLFNRYDETTLTLLSNKESASTKLYLDILQYFDDIGLPKQSMIESDLGDPEIKIRLTLNSKSKKSLEFLYNKESALTLQVTEDLFEKGMNPLIDSLVWEKGTIEIAANGNYQIIVIDKILEEQPKKLNEVKGSVISDYQNYLEKTWVEELKNRYSVEINYTTLDKIKKLYEHKLNHPG